MVGLRAQSNLPEALFRMSAAPARPKLAAARRAITGKKVAYLRRDGRLPAVVFGRGLSSDSVSLDTHEFESLRRQAGPNTLIEIGVTERDFPAREIAPGSVIRPGGAARAAVARVAPDRVR